MFNFHPDTPQKLRNDLLASDFVRKPMPVRYEETMEARCLKKPVLKSRLLDDMESLENWSADTLRTDVKPTLQNVAKVELSDAHVFSGNTSVKFTAPTDVSPEVTGLTGPFRGGIYCIPKAVRRFDHEDWREYNRISVWIYPDLPGFYNPCLRIQLHNEGEHPVPDVYDREGGHNMNLLNRQWNHVAVEIPYTWRDNVTALTFDYDMVGHNPGAAEEVCFYFDQLELQLVDEDHYEGWNVDKSKIAFSHLGYQAGGLKTAIASVLTSDTFEVRDAKTKQTVLTKAVDTVSTPNGDYKILNFTELTAPGEYYLVCGDKETPSFAVNDRVWMSSVWKTINFFFCERCGYRVPNKHVICHEDHFCVHGDKSVPGNGGWHDAGDMHQQQPLTCEITTAMFQLAMEVKADDPLLYKRVLDEATWGLLFLLKTRFGDGWRLMRSGTSIWTDGICGNEDDVTCKASYNAFDNLIAGAAEVEGWRALLDEDLQLAEYALRSAKEDFAFAVKQVDDGEFHPELETSGLSEKMTAPTLLAASFAYTGTLLYNATKDEYFAQKAAEYGNKVADAQQTRYEPDWDQKIIGFFYRDTDKKRILHYTHRSHDEKQIIALVELCKAFPEHPDWMKWHSAILFFKKMIEDTTAYTAPFDMIAAGVHDADEINDVKTLKLLHPIGGIGGSIEDQWKKALKDYQSQLDCGVKIGPQQYIRRFPIWFSFRGNTAIQLSTGKAVSAASIYLNDYPLYNLAQEQLMFCIGRNPFGQSIMFGEGYDYCQLYAVLPGDMVGAMGVGMESCDERDAPFWPQLNNCTYKEVWVASPGRWLWMMADEYMPARITVNCKTDEKEIRFTHKATGAVYTFPLENGTFTGELTAGEYNVSCGSAFTELTVVAGGKYTLDSFAAVTVTKEQVGKDVRLTVTSIGSEDCTLTLRTQNLLAEETAFVLKAGESKTVKAQIEALDEAWAAALLVNGDAKRAVSVIG